MYAKDCQNFDPLRLVLVSFQSWTRLSRILLHCASMTTDNKFNCNWNLQCKACWATERKTLSQMCEYVNGVRPVFPRGKKRTWQSCEPTNVQNFGWIRAMNWSPSCVATWSQEQIAQRYSGLHMFQVLRETIHTAQGECKRRSESHSATGDVHKTQTWKLIAPKLSGNSTSLDTT